MRLDHLLSKESVWLKRSDKNPSSEQDLSLFNFWGSAKAGLKAKDAEGEGKKGNLGDR